MEGKNEKRRRREGNREGLARTAKFRSGATVVSMVKDDDDDDNDDISYLLWWLGSWWPIGDGGRVHKQGSGILMEWPCSSILTLPSFPRLSGFVDLSPNTWNGDQNRDSFFWCGFLIWKHRLFFFAIIFRRKSSGIG